jgi:hypothetical protein
LGALPPKKFKSSNKPSATFRDEKTLATTSFKEEFKNEGPQAKAV